jgi:hypothetical protein
MSVVSLPTQASTKLPSSTSPRELRPALSIVGIGILGVLVGALCWQWRLPGVTALPALAAGACVWLLAALVSFAQERRGGRVAAALAASCPLLLFFACQGSPSVPLATLALALALLAAHVRWASRQYLLWPLVVIWGALVFLAPVVGLALLPLLLWASAQVPFYLRLTVLALGVLAWWTLQLSPPRIALESLSGSWLRRLVLLGIAGLPLGLATLLVGLPRLSRRTDLRRDERVRFVVLALVPGLFLLGLVASDPALTLTLSLFYLLSVALVLGESGESWPGAATAALVVGNAALLLWPITPVQLDAGWPSLPTLRQEDAHWQAIRAAIARTAPPQTTLILALPAEQERLARLLPQYRVIALTRRPRSQPTLGYPTLLLAGRRLDVLRDSLGLQLTDRASGQTRRLTAFVPSEGGVLPGTSDDVYWLQSESARQLRLGDEILLTR